jgi:hypothetical protein
VELKLHFSVPIIEKNLKTSTNEIETERAKAIVIDCVNFPKLWGVSWVLGENLIELKRCRSVLNIKSVKGDHLRA